MNKEMMSHFQQKHVSPEQNLVLTLVLEYDMLKLKYQFAWTQVVSETDVESQLDHKEELKLTQLIYMTEFCRY